MSTLFMIGNGFDINCGMKTKFSDMYEGYINEDSDSEIIKIFKQNLSADIENWGDFEMSMAKYAAKLSDESELLECIRDFNVYMKKYLLKEESKFEKKKLGLKIDKEIFEEMDRSFCYFYKGISHNLDEAMENRNAGSRRNLEMISFNYTKSLDDFVYGYCEFYRLSLNEVIHIHGTLQDAPVLGIDNIDQLNASYSISRKGQRCFIKPIFNDVFDKNRVFRAKLMIQNANTICVFGMSLGESDLSWRNEIIKWLKSSVHHHLFIYRYDLVDVKYRTIDEKMDIEDDEKDKILSEWEIEEELRDQIHVPCGINIFNIGSIISNHIEINMERKRKKGEEFIEEHLSDVVLT